MLLGGQRDKRGGAKGVGNEENRDAVLRTSRGGQSVVRGACSYSRAGKRRRRRRRSVY
jgi:hypothetical protein